MKKKIIVSSTLLALVLCLLLARYADKGNILPGRENWPTPSQSAVPEASDALVTESEEPETSVSPDVITTPTPSSTPEVTAPPSPSPDPTVESTPTPEPTPVPGSWETGEF